MMPAKTKRDRMILKAVHDTVIVRWKLPDIEASLLHAEAESSNGLAESKSKDLTCAAEQWKLAVKAGAGNFRTSR